MVLGLFRSTSRYAPLSTYGDNDHELEPKIPTIREQRRTFCSQITHVLVAVAAVLNIVLLPSIYFSIPKEASCPTTGTQNSGVAVPEPGYDYSWPEAIVRMSQKRRNAVYGAGSQVYISVEDSTFFRFPIPKTGSSTCAISWTPPASGEITTKGEISEIEVWSIVAPSLSFPEANVDTIDFDNITFNTRPVQGELLGTLNLKKATGEVKTVEFACPEDQRTLTVELKCLRVDCHVDFLETQGKGFSLARRH